ncbi:MAG TPA: hypothetical protein VG345_08205 [Bryobacteraceae bacterium]|jgi:hypothetical protein|nr:hypothetical protein [Bryobacteraceae bacterium]
MKRFLNLAIVVACAALTSAAYAQNHNPGEPPAAPPSAQSQESPQSAQAPSSPATPGEQSSVSITGCLTKGNAAGSYVITDQKSGEKYPFSGPAQLDKFVNQTVTLSGAITTQGADKAFRPERIAPVATTCEKAQ